MPAKSKATPSHKTVKRDKQQTIVESFCDQKGCQFFGQPAVQGVCFTTNGDIVDFDRLNAYEAELLREMAELKKKSKSTKDYVAALEAYYVTAQMNWQMGLDELVRLRRDNALLRARKDRR